jgi:glycosyltransferase involved in cell wall biosynthesis
MRAVAMLTTYNEERYLPAILTHYERHGLEVAVLDNESTDRSLDIAQSFSGRNVIHIQTIKRDGGHNLKKNLRAKELLADNLGADWYMHADVDEFRDPPESFKDLASAIRYVDSLGYSAINFDEFVFCPTLEAPNHDHDNFATTMKHYYYFAPNYPNRLNCWKPAKARIGLKEQVRSLVLRGERRTRSDLRTHAGHQVVFAGRAMFPNSFPMRHYVFLSEEHIDRKWVQTRKVNSRGQGFRNQPEQFRFVLPSKSDMVEWHEGRTWDKWHPTRKHLFAVPK